MVLILSEFLMCDYALFPVENRVPVKWFSDLKIRKLTWDRKMRHFGKFLLHELYSPIMQSSNCHISRSLVHHLCQSSPAENGYVEKWSLTFMPIKILESAWISIFRWRSLLANCPIYIFKNVPRNSNIIYRGSDRTKLSPVGGSKNGQKTRKMNFDLAWRKYHQLSGSIPCFWLAWWCSFEWVYSHVCVTWNKQ